MEQPKHHALPAIVTAAKDNLLNSDCLAPMFFIGNEDTIGILPADMSSNEMKSETASVIRSIVRKTDATFVIMVSEAYTIDATDMTPEEVEEVKGSSLSSHPKAVEKVLFKFETPTESWNGIADIGAGRVMGEVKWSKHNPKDGREEGRFANFFERATVQ